MYKINDERSGRSNAKAILGIVMILLKIITREKKNLKTHCGIYY